MKETAYLLQAALISVWWIGLAISPAFFNAFQFDEIPEAAFWSFFAPDIVLIALLSLVRAYRKSDCIEHVILGGFSYASLYCLNATMLTSSGLLPTGLMLLGLAYNAFLCFNQSLFRVSSSSTSRNILKTLIQIVCIWIIALVVIPYVLLDAFDSPKWPENRLALTVGSALLVSFSALGILSAFVMVRDGAGTPLPLDQTNNLVVSGPYQFVRNPMAIAGIGQGVAIAIMFQSVPVLVYSCLGALVWHVVVRPIEERDMVERFGEPYLDYRRRIACWFPRIRKGRRE